MDERLGTRAPQTKSSASVEPSVAEQPFDGPPLAPTQADGNDCTAPTRQLLFDHESLVLRRIDRQMRAHHGGGRRDSYRPWIHIRRRLSTRTSHQVLAHLPLRRRSFHFLSKIEEAAALVLGWLGAQEIREALPAWPIDHPSPTAGWEPDAVTQPDEIPGLLDIARDAGIDHGCYPGTRVPFVATVDLVAVLPPYPADRLLFVGCKPSSELLSNDRALERLELERLYAQACGGIHAVVHEQTFNAKLVENLQWLAPRLTELHRLQSTTILADFSSEFLRCSAELPVSEARNVAAMRIRTKEDPEALFRACLWTRQIDADLTKEIVRSRPLPRSTLAAASHLSKLLKQQ
jgi:hypothetical protein